MLGDDDFADIVDYLWDLDKEQLIQLGITLGLHFKRLKDMEDSKTFCCDLVHQWLNKVDAVGKKGLPTWSTLVNALRHRRVSQTGVAEKISKEKCVQ